MSNRKKSGREARTRRIQQIIFIAVAVIVIASWVLGLVINPF